MDAYYLWLLVGLATLGTFIWRFFGVVIGDRIPKDSLWSLWITAVGYAMVSGVMMIVIIYPSGLVAETPLFARISALAAAMIVVLTTRNILFSTISAIIVFLLTAQL